MGAPWVRYLPTQGVEAAIGCKVMNIIKSLGMPATRKVIWSPLGAIEFTLSRFVRQGRAAGFSVVAAYIQP